MPEDHGEEGTPGLPPDPLDRVWFHPSELGAPPAEPRPSAARRQWAVVAIATLCGAVATIGILAATGSIGSDTATVGDTSTFVPLFAQLQRDRTGELVAAAGASIVAVRATGADEVSTVDGSGVALGGDRVVTSAAAVDGAVDVAVTTDHGQVLTATVVGSDPGTDLALLDVQDAPVPAAETGSSDGLSVGSWVMAVAAAGGEDRWASQGVVSGLGVVVDLGFGATMPGMVATDVAAPPTAGGGVLIDEEGRVVAILSRVAPGHAVPVELAREVAEQLGANGRVRHAWLGVDAVDAVTRSGGGATVRAVSDGGPGQGATLQVGDVITSLDEARVADLDDLLAAVAHRRPGDPVVLTVIRGDRRLHLRTSLGERP